MLNARYQQGDLSLVSIDEFPQKLISRVASNLVLATDINGQPYSVIGPEENAILHTTGKAQYVEVTGPVYLEHVQYDPVQIGVGKYRVKKESEYLSTEHGRDVAKYTLMIGRALGFDEQHLKELEFASLLHDVGVNEMKDVLWKVQWFTDTEWEIVQQHPARGAAIVEKLKGKLPHASDRARDYVLYHHEHYDGSGYATGLVGKEIPIGARIMLIADAYDAMISWRPFREPLPAHVALDRLWADRGYRYDPELLDLFKDALEDEAITALMG